MNELNRHLQQAIAAARAGKQQSARVLLDRALKEEPDDANAWFLLGTLAESEEERTGAMNKVLEIDPSHAGAQRWLGATAGAAVKVEPVAAVEPEEEPLVAFEPEAQPAPATSIESVSEMPEEVVAAASAESIFAALEELKDEAPEPTATEARPLPVAEEPLDFLKQSEGDTLPSWMADQETLPPAAAETMLEEPAVEIPEEVPDWLKAEAVEEWPVEEPAGSGQVLWQAGIEADDILSPDAPVTSASQARPTPKKKRSDTGLVVLLIILIVLAILVSAALVYVLFINPL